MVPLYRYELYREAELIADGIQIDGAKERCLRAGQMMLFLQGVGYRCTWQSRVWNHVAAERISAPVFKDSVQAGLAVVGDLVLGERAKVISSTELAADEGAEG